MHIKLSNIKVRLPLTQRPLFHIPHFELASGQKCLIEGPSGVGKTTLLHLIAGLFQPSEGYLFLGDQNLHFLSEPQRCRLRRQNMGIIFQKLNLIDHLTVMENILLTLDNTSQSRQKALAALERVHMQKSKDQITSQLSMGEQQRVAVARVLAAQPKIILADEPTSSLDEKNAKAVMDALADLPSQTTLLTVSHDQRIRSYFKTIIDFGQLTT